LPVLSWRKALLDVVFYHTTHDLAGAEFDSVKPLIVCPSPLVADGLRRLLRPGLEIITISKWVSDFLKTKNKKKSSKAELMLRLSSVWRHYFQDEDAQVFFRSFEIFTDLRSFTLNLDLLSEFLNELDPKITKSILIFWAFLENEQIIDEHRSYQLMSEAMIKQPLWIIGFKHLSGIQIDMLKDIGEKTEVAVFFPKDVYEETLSTDWVRWILPEANLVSEKTEHTIQVIKYPKNKLNAVLNSLHEQRQRFDITLASQQSGLNFRQEVSFSEQFFKSPEDIFQIKREKFFEDLTDWLDNRSVPIEDLNFNLEEQKKALLLNEDFIGYKIVTLMNEALELYKEFQNNFDHFSLKVLKQIIELNSPRVSLATLVNHNESRIFDINELPYNESQNPLVIIASSNYGSLKSGEGNYSEKMIESLKVIAPLKRGGLEFSYRKNELRQALSSGKSLLLMEEGLELIDLAWREILKDFKLEISESNTVYKLKEKQDYLAARMKPGPFPVNMFSASRLQAFVDCPRKYYFSYIEKLDHRPDDRLKLGADEMGTLEHDIIAKYFKANNLKSEFNFDSLKSICSEELDTFIRKSKIILSEKTKLTTFFELIHFSQNGIEYLIEFCNLNNAISIEIETELEKNEWSLTGSIDCLVFLPDNHVAVLDFKRSAAAIGSKIETLSFDKLQIWTYLLYCIRHQKKKIHTWGYLNLSEIESSQIYDENKKQVIQEETIENFLQLINESIAKLKNEVQFLPDPRQSKICHFCEVQLFCNKGSC
jgi:RecB family exonuclease